MDILNTDSIIQPSATACKCYKASNLTKTILGSTEISNFDDRHILGEQLGWGRFGVIRACSDKLTGEVLACKSIAKERLVTLDDVRNVKLEIEIMTRLSGHPNVVNLKAVYEKDDYVHLLMELCAGGELFHWLEKHGRFSEHDARFVFRYLMQAVQYCHDNGIVHRDLKPENILLATKSSSSAIKLADFGLATYIKPGHNLCGTVGSPFYIAPEVLAGGYNQVADIWSAGVILYILLSGMPPFSGRTKSRIFDAVRAADLRFPSDPWDQISAAAKDLISGMLCVDPSKRLNAAQVLDHPWMQECAKLVWESYKQENLGSGQLEICGGCFSTSLFSRVQDYSFSYVTPVTDEDQAQSTNLTSSFSSFLNDSNTPFSASEGFSFSIYGELEVTKLSFPVQPMLSFSFFSPSSAVEKGDGSVDFKANVSKLDVIHGDTSLQVQPGVGEILQKTEFQREGANASRMSGSHSRRNHTIGLGELDQVNIVVTESVIRWASCTHIPTAPSLRLSLVC
uniref:Protein kinase domain-containing protein n=1 Tax=Rhizophora mucronata TaxID=61149 RepID=A0A2P2NZA2_RHIMU